MVCLPMPPVLKILDLTILTLKLADVGVVSFIHTLGEYAEGVKCVPLIRRMNLRKVIKPIRRNAEISLLKRIRRRTLLTPFSANFLPQKY